jgi:hypothetical protein
METYIIGWLFASQLQLESGTRSNPRVSKCRAPLAPIIVNRHLRDLFTKPLEAPLSNRFNSTSKLSAPHSSGEIAHILSHISKKIFGKHIVGCGVYNVPGWADWKLMLALAVTQI